MDSIVVILIIFSIVSSIVQGIKKKQVEQQKSGLPVKPSSGRFVFPASEQKMPTPRRESPPPITENIVPHQNEPRHGLERAFELMTIESDYQTMEPRFDERMTDIGEGTGDYDLQAGADSAAITALVEEQVAAPGITLSFDTDTVVKSVIYSQILERPFMRTGRRT